MNLIPTRMHGYLDYLVGALLIASPWFFGFANGGPEQWVPIIAGIAAIAYSLVTDYELGAVRILPMPVHLLLDAGSGAILAASPWIFGFADDEWVPHLVLGLIEIGAAVMTRRVPEPADSMNTDHQRLTSRGRAA